MVVLKPIQFIVIQDGYQRLYNVNLALSSSIKVVICSIVTLDEKLYKLIPSPTIPGLRNDTQFAGNHTIYMSIKLIAGFVAQSVCLK